MLISSEVISLMIPPGVSLLPTLVVSLYSGRSYT